MPRQLVTVVSDAFTRPANTSAYTIGDIVGPATLNITGATNATPIVITSVAHGLTTGDYVTIAAVGGNTNANGDWVVTVLSVDTFSIATAAGVAAVGNATYTSGGTAIRLQRLAGISRWPGGRGKILKTRLICNSATITNGTFRVYFLNASISQIADNAAWTLLYAQKAKLIGYTAALTLVTEGAGSDSGIAQDVASIIPFSCAAGSSDLFAVIVAEAAYTPTSGQTFYLEVTVQQER